MRKISIITPCRNAERYIGETVESVLGQAAVAAGRVELEYIICDGNSSDRTLAIVESYASSNIRIISEPDRGMYDALAKGLRAATGDIIAYLNAGDYYHRYAFDIVLDFFETKKVEWLTGYVMHYNEKSYLTGAELPYKYRPNLFACGLYGPLLPSLQQESTFWAASLNALLDYERLAGFRYAGDYYLWLQFSQRCDVHIVKGYLGGFRRNRGQLTDDLTEYYRELRSMTRQPGVVDYLRAWLDYPVWHCAPPRLKKRLNREGLSLYDHRLQEWV
jgi:glycosyltransferase involved in cell wall biosynthesis